jgi:hypothetical protein
MDFMDTPVSDMTIRDQVKVGLLLTAVTVGVTIIASTAIAGVKYAAVKAAERQNAKDDEEK